jgi:hypothetical protein
VTVVGRAYETTVVVTLDGDLLSRLVYPEPPIA